MKLFSFWSGSSLTVVERICLNSMLAAGHEVDLYTYEQSLAVPAGIVVKDARAILERDFFFILSEQKSAAAFSDMFRYCGLLVAAGTWVDTDMLFLKSIGDMGEHIYGWEDKRHLNGAVLRLPSGHPFLTKMRQTLFKKLLMLPHWPLERRMKQYLSSLFGFETTLKTMKWGEIGPIALTAYLRKSGEDRYAQKQEVFYPIHYLEAQTLVDPNAQPEKYFTESTRAVHLWSQCMAKTEPHPVSFMGRMKKLYI